MMVSADTTQQTVFYLMLVHVLDELHREHEKLLRREICDGADPDGGIKLLEAGVKIQRRLICEAVFSSTPSIASSCSM